MTATAISEYADAVRTNLEFTRVYLHRLVDDLPDDDLASRTEGVANHPAWTLGHLAVGWSAALSLVGRDPMIPEGWSDLFGPGSEPRDDRSAYPPKAELVDVLDRQQAALVDGLASLTPERASEQTPIDFLRDVFPTVRDSLLFMAVITRRGTSGRWRAGGRRGGSPGRSAEPAVPTRIR